MEDLLEVSGSFAERDEGWNGDLSGSMADILGQFFGGESSFGGGHPFSGLFGHSMGGGAGAGRNRRRKGEDVGHPLK